MVISLELGRLIGSLSVECPGMEPYKVARMAVSLAKKLGATDAVVQVYSDFERMVKFTNNEVAGVEERVESGAEIFVAIRERRAGVSINELTEASVRRAVKEAVGLAKRSQPSDIYAPLPKGPFKYDKALLRAGRVSGEPEKLIEHVETAISSALSEGAERVAGSLVYSKGKVWLRTSGGAYGVAEDASITISVRAFASKDATGHFVSVAARDEDFKPEEAGRRAGEIARMALNPVEGEPGTYEALLGPMTFANLIEELGSAASAFYVDAGLSFLAGKLEAQVASETLTLVDDPTIPGTYGSAPFDEEGVPTRRNTIIRDGVLKTYLHNSTTAKKFGVKTTANAGLIVPEPFNLIVEGKGKSLDKLIAEIDNGIYVTNDWYLRYQNYRTGDFSTIPRDGMFRIRRGGLDGAIKGLRISGNMLSIFKNLRELGEEKHWIRWWEVETPVLAPHAVIDELNFTKSTI